MSASEKRLRKGGVERFQQRMAQQDMVARTMLGGLVVAVLAGLAYVVWGPVGMLSLSTERPQELRDVLYGGQPWLIICHNTSGTCPAGYIA